MSIEDIYYLVGCIILCVVGVCCVYTTVRESRKRGDHDDDSQSLQ